VVVGETVGVAVGFGVCVVGAGVGAWVGSGGEVGVGV
jgi:hypothetical protein